MNETIEESSVVNHRILREVEKEDLRQQADNKNKTLHYRWLLSSINLFVEPEDLQALSLHAFETDIPSVTLTLYLPSHSDCDILPKVDKSACYGKVDVVEGLNNLTCNVSVLECS